MPENVEVSTAKLHPSRFSLAEHKRAIYYVVPVAGTKLETILDPAFWTHTASKMRPTDRIEVNAEDGSFFAELIVRDAGRTYAKVDVLRYLDFDKDVKVTGDAVAEVVWKGPHHKWAVVRIADKAILQGGMPTKEDASGWLIANAKSLAA